VCVTAETFEKLGAGIGLYLSVRVAAAQITCVRGQNDATGQGRFPGLVIRSQTKLRARRVQALQYTCLRCAGEDVPTKTTSDLANTSCLIRSGSV
jgi:hypothetical protein